MIGSSFPSLSSVLALHQRARSLPRKNELSPGEWRQRRPCIRASGTSLGNWLHSWVLPRADEYSPNLLPRPPPLTFRNLRAMQNVHTCMCFAYRPSRDYQTPELWLVPDARVRNLPHRGRGSSKGWKEPLLYRLILLWISCLSRLPNLTLQSPASPSMSQVSCGKKPDFISGWNRGAFRLYVASGGSLGLPLVRSAFDC